MPQTIIDRSPDAIALAKERARHQGFKQADFYVSSVEDFSPTEPFDLVIGRYVLMYQPTPAVFIRAARSHVRAGLGSSLFMKLACTVDITVFRVIRPGKRWPNGSISASGPVPQVGMPPVGW